MNVIHDKRNLPPPSPGVGRALLFIAAIVSAVLAAGVRPAAAQFEEITSRSFAVKFRGIDEILPLARALLSNKGQITDNRSMQVMVVSDYPTNLNRIDSLLSRYDVPLHQVRITVQLVLGSMVTEEEDVLGNPGIEAVLGGQYDFNRLEPIEKSTIITEEHKQTALELANGQFIAGFTPVHLPLEIPQVELRNFMLISVRKSLSGEERKQLLATSVAMEHEEEHVIGAMKYGLRNETLLVIVKTEILE